MDADFARALLDACPVGILVVDPVGTISYASPTAQMMTGFHAGDVEGTSIFDYLVEEAIEGIVGAVGYVQENPDVLMGPMWLGFRHADGMLRVLEVLATNRYDNPHLQGLVCAVRDNTTQFRLNEAMTSHGEDADRADVLGVLSSALLGLPVRGRAGFVEVDTGEPIVRVQLPDEVFGPAPPGWPIRPWQEALATGEGVYPADLDEYDPDLRAAAAAHGLHTIWAHPIPAPSRSIEPFASCLVVGRSDREPATLNERINVELVVRNAKLVFERDYYLASLSRAARSDALTGLANRAHLLRDRREPNGAGPTDLLPDAVLYVDLDGFKAVNDRLGHRAGDTVLVEIARRLRDVCRSGDEIGRLGGDEFVLLLWDIDEPDDAIAVAERILAVAEQPIDVEGPEGVEAVRVGASIGIALSQSSGERTLDALLHAADEALYDAKRSGRHRFQLAAHAS